MIAPQSASNMDSFLLRKPVEDLPRGATIYTGADHYYYVARGLVRIYRQVAGTRQVNIALCAPGEWFGESCVLDMDAREDVAEAVTPSSIMRWSPAEVRQRISSPDGAWAFMEILAARNAGMIERLMEAHQFTSVRLAMVLLRLDRQVGVDGGPLDPPRVLPGFTHEFLAAETGSTREIVTSCMGKLQRKGAILYDRRRIAVWPDRLAEAAHA